MIEKDTIKLLRECDAGVRMGIDSIDEVIDNVQNQSFKNRLNKCKDEHVDINGKIQSLLDQYGDDGKSPNPIAKGMSWIKTNAMLAVNDSDSTVADLMTDGCNMGVKSLSRYLNQYKAADEVSKDIAKKLISSEETLASDIRGFL